MLIVLSLPGDPPRPEALQLGHHRGVRRLRPRLRPGPNRPVGRGRRPHGLCHLALVSQSGGLEFDNSCRKKSKIKQKNNKNSEKMQNI